jgi:hypothetical protein
VLHAGPTFTTNAVETLYGHSSARAGGLPGKKHH